MIKANMSRDLEASGPDLSQSSRCLFEEAPIGGVVPFSSGTSVLPADLRTSIELCWKARGI